MAKLSILMSHCNIYPDKFLPLIIAHSLFIHFTGCNVDIYYQKSTENEISASHCNNSLPNIVCSCHTVTFFQIDSYS